MCTQLCTIRQRGMQTVMTPENPTASDSLGASKGKTTPGASRLDADAPEASPIDEDFWKRARVVMPSGKTSIHLRVDTDIFEWFKGQGEGHLTRMNAVLRSYVEAQKR
jgi:uncharacterized protein (DUF4415 family)